MQRASWEKRWHRLVLRPAEYKTRTERMETARSKASLAPKTNRSGRRCREKNRQPIHGLVESCNPRRARRWRGAGCQQPATTRPCLFSAAPPADTTEGPEQPKV